MDMMDELAGFLLRGTFGPEERLHLGAACKRGLKKTMDHGTTNSLVLACNRIPPISDCGVAFCL